ncbi:hypothetical protein KQX54_015377 [Cotesia glomerata]|uniref:Uncharacterized protein n=1 Tax=Cotesia glomerata TaxID=32391 RepID=A0AAV7IX35_COTGL|nr:hypothetical protein KQX54_015377 [Cotesia glomerata]
MKHIEPELEPVGLLFSWHDPRKALATPSVLLLMTRLYIHTLKLPLNTTYTGDECEGKFGESPELECRSTALGSGARRSIAEHTSVS